MKKYSKLLILILVLTTSCKKDKLNLFPAAPVLVIPTLHQTNVSLSEMLYWQAVSDPDGDEITYSVFFGEDSLQMPKVTENVQSTNFLPELEPHKKYFWKVTANDGKNGISESSIWSFTTLNNEPDTVILEFPLNNSLRVDYNLELRWAQTTDLDGDEITYRLFLDTLETFTRYVDMGKHVRYQLDLKPNKNYFWRVAAVDNFGGVTLSDVNSFTTKMGPPSSFQLLSPQDSTVYSGIQYIPLVWGRSTSYDNNKSVIAYDVYIDTAGTPTTLVAEGLTDPHFNFVGMLDNKTYYWKVVAKDVQSNQTESEIWRFITDENELKDDVLFDERDLQSYGIVQIGDQIWMSENLKYDTGEGSYCYNNDPSNCDQYGRIYTWSAATQACPNGWKVPSTEDWEKLIAFASQNGYEGKEAVAYKSKTGWFKKSGSTTSATINGTDEFNFNAKPTGRKSFDGTYLDLGHEAQYWTNTEIYTKERYFKEYVILRYYYDDFHIAAKGYGDTSFSSVRCIKK